MGTDEVGDLLAEPAALGLDIVVVSHDAHNGREPDQPVLPAGNERDHYGAVQVRMRQADVAVSAKPGGHLVNLRNTPSRDRPGSSRTDIRADTSRTRQP